LLFIPIIVAFHIVMLFYANNVALLASSQNYPWQIISINLGMSRVELYNHSN